MAQNGFGRNEIAQQLKLANIRKSSGSVSNIISAWKAENGKEQVTTSPVDVNISNDSDIIKTSSSVSPCQQLTCHFGAELASNIIPQNEDMTVNTNTNLDSTLTVPDVSHKSIPPNSLFANTLEEPIFISSEAQVDIEPTTNSNYITTQNDTSGTTQVSTDTCV